MADPRPAVALRLARVDARPRYVVTALPAHLAALARISRIARPAWRRSMLKLANHALRPIGARLQPRAMGEIRLDRDGAGPAARFRAANPTFSWQYLAPWAGTAEIETMALLERLVGPDDAFFDVGANWGYFSHALASRPAHRGAVHAFEPHPETHADLVSLAAQFGVAGRVTVHAVALSDRGGTARFDAGHRNDPGTAALSADGAIEVRTATLDSLGLPAPAAIKIDVEGHERAVIDGARSTLAAARPFVVLENWPGAAGSAAALAALAALDYAFLLPAWAIGERLVADVRLARERDGHATLALLPFEAVDRDRLEPSQPNVLACPRERLADLDARLDAGQARASAPSTASSAASA